MSKKTKTNLKSCGACITKKMNIPKRGLGNNKSGAYRWSDFGILLIRWIPIFKSLWDSFDS